MIITLSLKLLTIFVSFGFAVNNNRIVNSIIVHSAFNNSGGEKYDIDLVIKQFSTYGVSAHYVIGRDGTVYQCHPFNKTCGHAGKSEWKGFENLNSCSIGIELANAGDDSQLARNWSGLALTKASHKKIRRGNPSKC